MTTKYLTPHHPPHFQNPKRSATTVFRPFLTINLSFLLLAILILALPTQASEQKDLAKNIQKIIIMDFESDEQLDELSWKCGTTYERTKEHATSGQFSLKIEMYPKVTWPGFGKGIKKSWTGYDYLSINIFNPSPELIRLSYRIDDRRDNPPYADRANGRLLINPGANTITFNLKELKTSDGKRPLDLEKICSFLLFLHNPEKKVTLFLDDLAVTKESE